MRALVTGSGGLVGSESVRLLIAEGWEVVGFDNDMRRAFFGVEASTEETSKALRGLAGYTEARAPSPHNGSRGKRWMPDVTIKSDVEQVFMQHGPFDLVIHAAAQPSHDWAAKDPQLDFAVNANGTLNMLEMTRRYCPDAAFCFLSTNKVYGDRPNGLPLHQKHKRLELPGAHAWYMGIDTSMSIDQSTHSLFGVSKTAADLLVQEYGRYFGMDTIVFRCGCITGAAHAGAELHGFLAYLMKAAVEGRKYTVYGYDGLQVRDNISGRDVARACLSFLERARPGVVVNLGGGRENSCSVLEAIDMVQRLTGKELDYELVEENRIGDHRWWISGMGHFKTQFDWEPEDALWPIVNDMYKAQMVPA